ncbi:hypothetical protein MK805_08940 [Shimazuella sp. AN120528]|uniref:hypothetical protein n=1 Tax=Shimazuella soli TaxID=1892854 RepID=UPI001F0D87F2|nr:hypothetical protein [Shimazuella soli]MCH5585095.1 hypothetical protein [Shimazuella soli]
MMDSQEPKKNRSFKEKAADGWILLKQLTKEWAIEVYANKKRFVIIAVALIFCIVAFIRGLVLMLFF